MFAGMIVTHSHVVGMLALELALYSIENIYFTDCDCVSILGIVQHISKFTFCYLAFHYF